VWARCIDVMALVEIPKIKGVGYIHPDSNKEIIIIPWSQFDPVRLRFIMVVSPPMPTATAQAAPNLAFIKYWGIVTKDIAMLTRFCIFFGVQNRG